MLPEQVWQVWQNGYAPGFWRYVPRAEKDGSWQTWDRKEQLVIPLEKLLQIPVEMLRKEKLLH